MDEHTPATTAAAGPGATARPGPREHLLRRWALGMVVVLVVTATSLTLWGRQEAQRHAVHDRAVLASDDAADLMSRLAGRWADRTSRDDDSWSRDLPAAVSPDLDLAALSALPCLPIAEAPLTMRVVYAVSGAPSETRWTGDLTVEVDTATGARRDVHLHMTASWDPPTDTWTLTGMTCGTPVTG